MEGLSEYSKPEKRIEKCPFCSTGEINITFIPSYISWHVSRIAAGSKRTKFIHDPKTIVHNSCPNCGKSKREVKHALERGGKPISHVEQILKLRNAGLPLKLNFHSSK